MPILVKAQRNFFVKYQVKEPIEYLISKFQSWMQVYLKGQFELS
jgi:hypothetical protein